MAKANKSLPLTVFISYAHKDEGLKDELMVHLANLRRQGYIKEWHDRMLVPGTEWAGDIDKHLASTDVILLLISPDFMNSDYCYGIELGQALKRHEAGEARVIPIILRPCDWKGAPFGKLQGLPKDARPVTRWPDRDEAFTNVALGIRAAIEQLTKPSAKETAPSTRTATTPKSARPTTKVSAPRRTVASAITDSGDLVLLGDHVFHSQSVTEGRNGLVELEVVPEDAREDALIRALQAPNRNARELPKFASGNNGFTARVQDATARTTGGKTIWTITLQPDDSRQNSFMEVTYNGVTADELAELRARLLLLDEKPAPSGLRRDPMDSYFAFGALKEFGVERGVLPKLVASSQGSMAERLRIARLWLVFYLKATGICEHIFELSLAPASTHVKVTFHGQRKRVYSNVEPSLISLEGKCPLK